MTPQELHAQILHTMQVLQAQRRADPYGFAFGPRRPLEGLRPGPFGLPPAPPVALRQPPHPGWGSSGWDWGRGAHFPPGFAPPVRGLSNPAPRPNFRVNL